MNKLVTVLLVLLIATVAFSGDIRLGIFTGVSIEDFERSQDGFEPEENASSIPLGIQAEATVLPLGIANISTGLEASFMLAPYAWELTAPGLFESTLNFNQNLVGIYAKAYILPGKFQPYAKLGVGYYFGNFEVEVKELLTGSGLSTTEEVEVDGALGINAGVGLRLGRLFLEIDYHGVTRELGEGDELDLDSSFDTSTMGFKIGYQFYL